MKITIEFIPHLAQRYNTCGDWVFDADGNLTIRVSKLANEDEQFLVAVHELVEALACKAHNISQVDVDRFDLEYDHTDAVEAGDQPDAPYYEQHQVASAIERVLALELGVSWVDYEDNLNELTEEYDKLTAEREGPVE